MATNASCLNSVVYEELPSKPKSAEFLVHAIQDQQIDPVKASAKQLSGFRHKADVFFVWLKENKIDSLTLVCRARHRRYHSIHSCGIEVFDRRPETSWLVAWHQDHIELVFQCLSLFNGMRLLAKGGKNRDDENDSIA